jgi:ribosomal protein L37E
MRKFIYILLCVIGLTFAIPAVSAVADLGNFNDYDSGGSSYSGGSSSSSSDWSYGGSSYGGRSYGSSGYRYGYDYDDGEDSGGSFVFGFAVVIVIILIATYMGGKGGKNGGNGGNGGSSQQLKPGANVRIKDNTDEIVTAIQKNDPNFSYDKYIGWVKEVFITLQTAWSERDFAKARPFEKEELYKQHETQIKNYIENGRINVLDRLNVNQAYLYKYVREREYEYLTVYLQTRMTDYIKDEKTGAVLKGDPNAEYHLRYLYTFMRKTGVLTDSAKSNKSTVSCPHCGAPTSITSAGKCEYCGFIVTTGEFDWVLSNIEAIKDGMTFADGGVVIRE